MDISEFNSAIITDIKDLSPTVKEFTLLPSKNVTFIPGQFIILKINGIERSYSISSSTLVSYLQIIVALNPNGLITPLLFKMKINDCIDISGPKGLFILPNPLPKNIIFICTGTGIAPFKSMIESVLIENNVNISLIFGNRKKEDILYNENWLKHKFNLSNFNFYPTLSQEKWEGNMGYVHPIYMEKIAIPENSVFYVCGWKNMLEDCRINLKQMGFNRKQYKFEQYN